jgi:hypothetical protein
MKFTARILALVSIVAAVDGFLQLPLNFRCISAHPTLALRATVRTSIYCQAKEDGQVRALLHMEIENS